MWQSTRNSRRRGIGRALTVAAMHHARQRRASETWLHVRDDNPGAIALYAGLGFDELARRYHVAGKDQTGNGECRIPVLPSDRRNGA